MLHFETRKLSMSAFYFEWVENFLLKNFGIFFLNVNMMQDQSQQHIHSHTWELCLKKYVLRPLSSVALCKTTACHKLKHEKPQNWKQKCFCALVSSLSASSDHQETFRVGKVLVLIQWSFNILKNKNINIQQQKEETKSFTNKKYQNLSISKSKLSFFNLSSKHNLLISLYYLETIYDYVAVFTCHHQRAQ